MSDVVRPGEIDLETGQTAETVATPEPAAATETAAAAEPATETAEPVAAETTEAAAEPTEKKGMLGELIAERKERKELERRLRQIESDPALQRLTPELRQALVEGRPIHVQPPQADPAKEQARLLKVAERLSLYKYDANQQLVPDLDKAKEADALIRETAEAAVAPVKHMTLAEKAMSNYATALQAAKANGMDETTIQEVFGEVLQSANGAELLSQKHVAERLWEVAVGRMVASGKWAPKGQPAAPVKPQTPAAIVTESTGRRGGAHAAIQLSPKVQSIYREHGLDPAKGYGTQQPVSLTAGVELE
jgi:hypothetical protein